jgi:hypothetical protein
MESFFFATAMVSHVAPSSRSRETQPGTANRWLRLQLPNNRGNATITELTSKHLSTLWHLCCVQKATLLVCLSLVSLTSCSHEMPISHDELQSKLRLAASLAAETTLFIDYVRQQRATDQYAKGHIQYLSSEVDRLAKELHHALPTPGTEPQFADRVRQVDGLAAELSELRSRIDDPDELAREQNRFAVINQELQQAISSL